MTKVTERERAIGSCSEKHLEKQTEKYSHVTQRAEAEESQEKRRNVRRVEDKKRKSHSHSGTTTTHASPVWQ